ncbi:MAG TPA: hypothetical protein VE153_10235 [Myxococcus sp.]|nr:hypothetical protein [Myxococcus sp.]
MNRMHWLDALAARVLVARQPRFFEDGWGSTALLEKLTRDPQGFAFPELSEVAMRRFCCGKCWVNCLPVGKS